VSLLAIALTVTYLAWRATFTLNLSAWWLSVPLLLLEVHAVIGLGLYTFSLWDLDADPPPPVQASRRRVAVLIPTYNEPEEVLTPTIAAAVLLCPAHQTWVLDDGARPVIARLAAELGAQYLARSERVDAKAGNLNHALAMIDADLIAVFDADHVATPSFLTNTLGYFDDPRVAVVQTPKTSTTSPPSSTAAPRPPTASTSSRCSTVPSRPARTAGTPPSGAGPTRSCASRPYRPSAGWPRGRSPRISIPPSGCTAPAGAPSTTTRSSPAAWPPAAPLPT